MFIMSSMVPSRFSTAAASDKISVANGPMMWMPRTSPYFSPDTTLMKPPWLPRMVLCCCRRRELAGFHGEARVAGLFFGHADGADLRLAISGVGDAQFVDGVGGLAGDMVTATMPSIMAACANCGRPATMSPMA